jgi:tRNA-modifying protein YgfZ
LTAHAPPFGAGAATSLRSLIWVEGPDAASFLQGLLTNDVVDLPVGNATYALLLDAKGRIRLDVHVVRDGDTSFTLATFPEFGSELADALERYHFSEDLEILGPEPSDALLLIGTDSPADLMVLPSRVPGLTEVLVDDAEVALGALGVAVARPQAAELLRIEAGVPRVGVDTSTTTLVQEAGLEAGAVSFLKGCYLGQETVARAQHRGAVRRRLRGLVADEPLEIGASVTVDGREVGTVTSAVESPRFGDIGLAILRDAAVVGAVVQVGEPARPATVTELPFR